MRMAGGRSDRETRPDDGTTLPKVLIKRRIMALSRFALDLE
jgi:hypothetical protein